MIEFENGYYQGELNNNKREGFGVFYWDSGQIYIGKWNKDQLSDEGIVYFSEGGCAYGNFHRNKLSGYACVSDPNGNMIVGHFSRGVLESGVWNEKSSGKWFKYDVQNQEVNRDYELTTKSQIPQIVSIKEMVKKMLIECQGRKCIKYLEYKDTTWYVGVTNDNGKVSSGLGIMIDNDNKALQVGYFKGKKLNGFGRQYLGFMINDGIFEHQEFKYGTQFFVRDKKFFYGFFSGNQIKKIIKSGTGYPSYLLSYYKHPSKYANSKIEKIQEQEVMQDLQNRFMCKFSTMGYSEIYRNSPKKKNLLLFVENKYSEDFISPQCSVYQEVLEAAQHARQQRGQYSYSPIRKTQLSTMNKKELQLQDGEYNNYSQKQQSSKISPSSSSSYTPSNIRLQNMNNYQSRQSKESISYETEKKKSKSIDFMQQNIQQTEKKATSQQDFKFQRNSKLDNSQTIRIQDDQKNSSSESQFTNYSIQSCQQMNSYGNKSKTNIQQSLSGQILGSLQKTHTEPQEYQINNSNLQNEQQGMAQKIMNQLKKKSLNLNQSNESQNIKAELVDSQWNQQRQHLYKKRDTQSSQQQFNINENNNNESLQINNSQQFEQDLKRNSNYLSNKLQQQFQQSQQLQNSIQNQNKDFHDSFQDSVHLSQQSQKNIHQSLKQQNNQINTRVLKQQHNNNQIEDDSKQVSQLQDLLSSFNGSNGSLNQKLNQSIKNPQEIINIQPNSSQNFNRKIETEKMNFLKQSLNNQQINSEIDQYNIPNALAPDSKYENSSFQDLDQQSNENMHLNDKQLKYSKHETPRFDLTLQGVNGNNNQPNQQDECEYVKRQKRQNGSTNDQTNHNENYEHHQIENQEFYDEQDYQMSQYNNSAQQENQIDDDQLENSQNFYQSNKYNIHQDNNYKMLPDSNLDNHINDSKYKNPQQSQNKNFDMNNKNNYKNEGINNQGLIQMIPSNILQNEVINFNKNNSLQQSSLQKQILSLSQKLNESQSSQTNGKRAKQSQHLEEIQDQQSEISKSNSFEMREKSESIQLPKNFVNNVLMPINYKCFPEQDMKGHEEEEMSLLSQNGKIISELSTPNCLNEDLIQQSEQQNTKIVQKLQNLNKAKQVFKKDESDSFECNINQESQLDIIDSVGNNIKSEDYYKSLLQTIPENTDLEQKKKSSSFQMKPNSLNNSIKVNNESRFKSISIPNYERIDSISTPDNKSIQKLLQNDNQIYMKAQQNSDNNQIYQQNPNIILNQFSQLQQKQQNNQSIDNFINSTSINNSFTPINQQSKDDDIQNTTLDDDDDEGKTKFKYINQSPIKGQVSAKKRKKIFDTPSNNSSFYMTTPSQNKLILQSPQMSQLSVIMPQNNIQQISEFNIHKLITQPNQNKQEYSPEELSELYKFQKEKNKINSVNSIEQINPHQNQLIFSHPQQEFSTQNTNNYQSNTTHGIRQKQLNNTFHTSFQPSNSNLQQFQSSNPNLKQVLTKNDFNSNKTNNSCIGDKSLQYHSNESHNRFINDNQMDQNIEPKQNTQLLINPKSLRQTMNTDKDNSFSQHKGFFTENGLSSHQSNFFTNSSCQPVQSFKYMSESENKVQYNNMRCSYSRNLQQSLNELNENQILSNSFNQKYSTQNDQQQDDSINTSLKDFYESKQKNNKQFQSVYKLRNQTKENGQQYPQFNHKSRNQINLNINLSEINNEILTPEKANPRSLNTPSSYKTISMSTLQKSAEQKQKNDGILDQFINLKNNFRNQNQLYNNPEQNYQSSYLSLNQKQFS